MITGNSPHSVKRDTREVVWAFIFWVLIVAVSLAAGFFIPKGH